MDKLHLSNRQLPLESLERIEIQCGEFENALKVGQHTAIEDRLQGYDGAEREVLLFELICLELEHRVSQRQDISQDEYRRRFSLDENAVVEAFHRFPTAVDLPTVIQRIVKSSLVDKAVLDLIIKSLDPKRTPRSATELLVLLVQERHLTEFQANAIRHNKQASLTMGDYAILDHIARGGMGTVYKAEHRAMKRLVAVKALRLSAINTPGAAERFRREIRACAQLQHP